MCALTASFNVKLLGRESAILTYVVRKLLQVLTCVVFLFTLCPPRNLETSLYAEAQDAFEWFDTLGYPDLAGRQYVRVATGYGQQTVDGPKNLYMQAFLLEDKGEEFTVFTVDLFTRSFVKTPPGTEEHERVGYEVLDLPSEVTTYLEELSWIYGAKGPDAFEERLSRRFRERLGERSELFVLARACAANGLEKLADDVYMFASVMPDWQTGEPGTEPLWRIAEDEIAHATMWRNVLAFGDISISRQELLDRFGRFVTDFPRSEHMPLAMETVVLLRQMVREDGEHVKRARTLEAMTLDERVSELIFQLRDQNGRQWSQPGACDIFWDERGEESPAHQLVRIGYPAVPQLIAALDDNRFTRSVGYWRDFAFSHHVLRVGDAALAILEAIAGRSFYTRSYTNAEMTKDDETAAVKAEVEAWWRRFQEKGEKQVLIEAAEVGDDNSPQQARLLAEKYPDAALEAIARGVHNAEDPWVHIGLVSAVMGLEGEAPVPLLLSVVDNSPYLASRVVAAEGLRRHGHPEGITAMIKDWLKLGEVDPDESNPRPLIYFLATCGDLAAVQSLGKELHKWPVDVRYAIVGAFGPDMVSMRDSPYVSSRLDEGGESPEVTAAIEELLIQALDDTEEYTGSGTGYSRMCDHAAYVLSQRWPDQCDFDPKAPLIERNRKLVELKNVWRETKGLALLPLPQPPEIPAVSGEVIRPLLDRVIQSDGKDQKAIEGLEDLGLGALPAVRALLVEEGHPAWPAIAELATRLANVAREVVVDPNSAEPDLALAEQIEALKGKPLVSQEVIALMFSVVRNPLPGSAGIEIHAERTGYDTGVILSVRLIEATSSQADSQKWSYSFHVAIDDYAPLGASGSGYEYDQIDAIYAKFVEALDVALRAAPEKIFWVRLVIQTD